MNIPSLAFDPNRVRPRQILIVLAICALAFALRAAITFERAAGDPRFVPMPGMDQFAYVDFARQMLDGYYPNAVFYFQPGTVYVYAALGRFIGIEPGMLRLGVGLLDALACGWLAGAAWLLARREWAGYLAALGMAALYPVSVFYGTTLLSEPLAAQALALFLFLLLWQRERMVWWRSLALGLLGGALAVLRLALVLVVLFWWLWLLLEKRGSLRALLLHGALSLLGMLLFIAPFTLSNAHFSGGRFIPIAATGSREIYIGNSRTSSGSVSSPSLAEQTADIDYSTALLRDIRIDPLRWAGLMLRKAAIFWGAVEPGSNIDFYEVRAISPTLQRLPDFNFTHLAALGLAGLAALFFADRRLALAFAALLLLLMAGTIVGYAVSRIRYPVVMPMLLLAAYGVAQLLEGLRAWRALDGRVLLRRYAPFVLGFAALLLFPMWALSGGKTPPLPPKRVYAALPADAIRLDARFGPALRLLGWRSLAPWPVGAQHWTQPDREYAIELFWALDAPTDAEYNFYLAYIHNDERIAALDRPLGAVAYPPLTTEAWQPGVIYGEIPSFKLPAQAVLASAGRVEVGVYTLSGVEGDADRLIERIPLSELADAPALTLHSLALFRPDQMPEMPVLPPSEWIFGADGLGRIALRGMEIPAEAAPGSTITLRFAWEAIEDLRPDLLLFLHVMDSSDQLAAQGDGSLSEVLPTSTWMPGYPILTEIALEMPAAPGEYAIYGGLIDAQTLERLPVDALDFRPRLGTIRIREDG